MLLAIDAGNSSIEIALLDKDVIISKGKVAGHDITERDLMTCIGKIASVSDIDGVVISNVVKELHPILEKIGKEITPSPLFVDAFMDLGYSIEEAHKSSLGADIVATCAGATALYGDCIVVDTGTATTFQVLKNNKFLGGVVAAGLYMGVQALYDFTSLLPKVTVTKPKKVLSMDTIECMRSGAFYGHVAMIEGILVRIKNEVKTPMEVIATGGAADMISEVVNPRFDIVDNNLIFKGLKIIYDKNREIK